MKFPEGTQVGLYGKAGNLLQTVDVAPDGQLAEPLTSEDGQWALIGIPGEDKATPLTLVRGTWDRLIPAS